MFSYVIAVRNTPGHEVIGYSVFTSTIYQRVPQTGTSLSSCTAPAPSVTR